MDTGIIISFAHVLRSNVKKRLSLFYHTSFRQVIVSIGNNPVVGGYDDRFISGSRKHLTCRFDNLVEGSGLYFFHFKICFGCLCFCEDNLITMSFAVLMFLFFMVVTFVFMVVIFVFMVVVMSCMLLGCLVFMRGFLSIFTSVKTHR